MAKMENELASLHKKISVISDAVSVLASGAVAHSDSGVVSSGCKDISGMKFQ